MTTLFAKPLERRTALTMLFGGLALAAAGLILMGIWGDVTGLQRSSSAEEFASVASGLGNPIRRSGAADILLFVPGNTLLWLGLLGLYRSERTPLGSRRLAIMGSKVSLAAGVVDQVENLCLQLGLGRVDLESSDKVVAPAGWLIGLLRVSNLTKWVLLLGVLVALAGLVFFQIRARLAPSARCG